MKTEHSTRSQSSEWRQDKKENIRISKQACVYTATTLWPSPYMFYIKESPKAQATSPSSRALCFCVSASSHPVPYSQFEACLGRGLQYVTRLPRQIGNVCTAWDRRMQRHTVSWRSWTVGPNRLEARTTRCGRVNPGSIPGSDTFASFSAAQH